MEITIKKQTQSSKKKFGMILPITLLAYLLIILGNSIVFTGLVKIQESLGLSSNELAWISNAYSLTFGGFLLLSGRLSDLLGRKKIFQIGLLVFGVSSLAIGLAQSAAVIIIARALQGVASAIIAPVTLALMMDAYSGEQRVKAIAYYGATAGIGSSIGLLIGGVLTEFVSWRAGFLINIPVVILLVILTYQYIRKDEGQNVRVDYLGSILSVVGLALFIYGLNAKNNKMLFIIGGILFLVAFYFYEKKQENPIMPLELYKNKVRFGSYIVRALFMMSMLPYWFFFPQYLQKVYNYSVLEAGLAFAPLTLTMFLAALLLPKLTKRFGNNRILLIGEIILLVGLIWTAYSSINGNYVVKVALPMIVVGVGQAFVLSPVTAAAIYKAPLELAGAASGLTNAMHQIGGPIGISLILLITTDFYTSIKIMALFTALALIIAYIFIYRTAPRK